MQWFLLPLKKYAVFTGRARRKEYWYFNLFLALLGILLGFLAMMVLNASEPLYEDAPPKAFTAIMRLGWVLGLLVTIPSIAVTVRRLHDTGRSGWFCLLYFVPAVGGIILLVFCLLDSQPGTNQYGPNPKENDY